MKIKVLKNTQYGFSLIEVIVATSVMAFMALGIATMMEQQAKSISYYDDKLSRQSLVSEINLLFDKEACQNSLKDLVVPQKNSDERTSFVLKDKNDKVLFDPNRPGSNRYDKLKISDVKIQNEDITNTNTSGTANIILDLQRIRNFNSANEEMEVSGQYLPSIRVPIGVTVNSDMEVLNCSPDKTEFSCLKPFKVELLDAGDELNIPGETKAIQFSHAGGSRSYGHEGQGATCSYSGIGFTVMTDGTQLSAEGKIKRTIGHRRSKLIQESSAGSRTLASYTTSCPGTSGVNTGAKVSANPSVCRDSASDPPTPSPSPGSSFSGGSTVVTFLK